MSESHEKRYLKHIASRLLSEINDLKRTSEVLASELGIEHSQIKAVFDGRADREQAYALIHLITQNYPVSLADIWIDEDDTNHGVKLMPASESEATSRVFDRVNAAGELSEYYEYRDTAMSRLAPFKPEWIAQLRVVNDADPENPDVAYNNGHFLHQTTFFIGPVNFYWELEGRKHCAKMSTGDSNYITPFVPHSFTTRDISEQALILAVTYGGQVSRARREISTSDMGTMNRFAGDLRRGNPFLQRLERQLAAESLATDELILRLIESGGEAARWRAICHGEIEAAFDEVMVICNVLSVRPQDLLSTGMTVGEEVVVTYGSDGIRRSYPSHQNAAYELKELARSRHQPNLKGFEVKVTGECSERLCHTLHEYLFNFGTEPVDLVWNDTDVARLNPGDSAYIRPMIEHRFIKPLGATDGRLLMIRVAGQLTNDALDEYASFEVSGRNRVSSETGRWF
jgi:hypothetical protein